MHRIDSLSGCRPQCIRDQESEASTAVSRYPVGACPVPVPDTSGSVVHTRTSRFPSSPTVFLYPVVAGLVPEAAVSLVPSRSAFQMRTGRHQNPPAVPRSLSTGPGVRGIGAPYLTHFGLAPPGGSSRRCSPRPGVTTSRPKAPTGIGISLGVRSGSMLVSKGRRNSTAFFPQLHQQTGQLQFPPPRPLHRTAPGSSSYFFILPSNFSLLVYNDHFRRLPNATQERKFRVTGTKL